MKGLKIAEKVICQKKDEQIAIDAILEWIKHNYPFPTRKTTYEPNKGMAPDWLLNFRTHLVAVEVRQSGEGFIFTSNHSVERREPYERALTNMLRKIEELLKKWIKPNETIILTFLSPIPKYKRSKLAKTISNKLEKIYKQNNLLLDQKLTMEISTNDLSINSIELAVNRTNFYANKPEYNVLMIILACALKSPNKDIENSCSLQAEYILYTAIKEKTKKTDTIQEEKWLAIVNTHPGLNVNHYRDALNKLNDNHFLLHDFTKIFIIYKSKAMEIIANQKFSDYAQ